MQLPPIDPQLKSRIVPLEARSFSFLCEPMAAVRLNYHSRFTAEEGSAEWGYVRWKDNMRDLFDQLDYQDHARGVPFHEPLSLSGQFLVSENFDSKDLDNLIKAILDAMNPVRNKNFSGLRNFLWTDDCCIKHFGGWMSLPAINAESPRIDLAVTPLWGRVDPMLNYLEGFAHALGDRRFLVSTGLYSFCCVVPAGVGMPVGHSRLWVLSNAKGLVTAVAEPEQVILYRELINLPRVSEGMALSILGIPWNDVLEGLATGNAQYWVTQGIQIGRASTALSQVREKFTDPKAYLLSLAAKFDQTVFDRIAEITSEKAKTLWTNVRDSLVSANFDWFSDPTCLEQQAFDLIEETYASAKQAQYNRNKQRKLAKTTRTKRRKAG